MKQKKNVGAILGEYGAFLALIILVVGLSIISPEFRQPSNFLNLLRQATFNGLIAVGMTCVILSDGIDLSVGSTFALSAIICAELIMMGLPAPVAILCALLSGILLGMISGLLVTKGGMPSMIATMAMQSACRSVINHFGSGGPFTVDSELYESFRMLAVGGIEIGPSFKIPYLMIIFIVFVIIFDNIMRNTKLGKHVYAVGSNEVSARLSGINVDLVKTLTFVITGLMCGVAALIYASRMTAVAAASAGSAYEMDAIAAVAIGGTSMSGGRGKIVGTFAGVLMFKIISNILTAADVSTFLNGAISGAIIVIAVLLQNFQNRKR